MGSEARRYVKTRQLIDYHNFVGGLEQSHIYCISDGVMSAIRQLLRERGLWRTSYVTAFADGVYYIPDSDEFNIIDNAISEFLNEGATMATCNELIETLEALQHAIFNNSGAGCGCGSAGATGQPASEVDVGLPGENEGEPPDGFSDWTEYETYKCDLATKIVNDLKADMKAFATFDVLGASAVSIGAVLLTPVPFDDILLALGLAILWASTGVFTVTLGEIVDAIENNFDELVCALFASPDATSAKANIQEALDTAIEGDVTAGFQTSAKLFASYWLNYDNINRLFNYEAALIASETLPIGDCSGCVTCPEENFVSFGTEVSATEFDSAGQVIGPVAEERLDIYWGTDEAVICGTVTITDVTVTGGPLVHTAGSINIWRLINSVGTIFYNSDTEPSWPVSGIARLVMVSAASSGTPPNDFSIDVDYSYD